MTHLRKNSKSLKKLINNNLSLECLLKSHNKIKNPKISKNKSLSKIKKSLTINKNNKEENKFNYLKNLNNNLIIWLKKTKKIYLYNVIKPQKQI